MSITKKNDLLATAVAGANAALDTAKAVQTKRRDALDAANTAAQDLLDRLDCGDATVTSADTMRSREDVENAARLLAAADAAVARAVRAVPNSDTSLADVLVASGMFDEILPVAPTVTTIRPTGPPEALPAAFLVQSKPSQGDDIHGTIGGSVDLLYFASPHHRDVEGGQVERAARQHRVNLTANTQGRSERDGVVTQQVSLSARHVWPTVPVVRAMDFAGTHAFYVKWFGDGVAAEVRDSMQAYDAPEVGMHVGFGGDSSAPAATVRPWSRADLISQTYDRDGTCRTVLGLTVKVYPGKSCYLTGDHMQAKLLRAVEGQKGRCAQALGRVIAVQLGQVGLIDGGGLRARAVEAEVIFTSALPEGAAVPTGKALTAAAAVPSQRPAEDVREHLDDRGSDKRKHPGARK